MKKALSAFIFLFLVCIPMSGLSAKTISASGYDGSDGSNGSDGWFAGDGGNGSPGGDGRLVEIFISKEGDKFVLSGSVGNRPYDVAFPYYGEKLYIYSNGGDGGHGGDGGDGYRGRHGRDGIDGHRGRRGRPGRDGRDGTRHSPDGHDGKNGKRGYRGGNGTDGTDGGDGGNGGNGGNGALGGDGGDIRITFMDPAVLMHLSVSNYGGSGGHAGDAGSAGPGGLGGDGGDGGAGGYGGPGGEGGRGYRCSQRELENGCRHGRDGRDGSIGPRGFYGRDGMDGRDGSYGMSGRSGSSAYSGVNGAKEFVHVDENGNVLATYDSLENIYHLKITKFKISEIDGDGVFEPGEEIALEDIHVKNVGGMMMPQGGVVNFHVHGETFKVNVPAIKAGEEWSHQDRIQLRIPSEFPVNRTFVVRGEVTFQGLSFYNSDLSGEVSVQYPLVVKGSNFENWIPHGKKVRTKITLQNISKRAYDLDLEYKIDGFANMEIVSDVTRLKPGETKEEVIEYHVSGNVDYYELSKINSTLKRGELSYEEVKAEFRNAPHYSFSKKAKVLVLSNGYNAESFQSVTHTLNELNLPYDVYDINVEGPPSSELLSRYQNKVIFIASYTHISSELKNKLKDFLQNPGGVAMASYEQRIKTPNYRNPVYWERKDFFMLSQADQVSFVKNGYMAALPNPEKIKLLKKYFYSESDNNLQRMRDAYITELKNEFLLSSKSDVYEKENWAAFYDLYASGINAANEFEYRFFFLKMIEDFLKFEDLDGDWREFEDVIEDSIEAHEELGKLAESCGEIEGRYVSKDSVHLHLKKTIFGNVKGELLGGSLEFKGREFYRNTWNLNYDYGDEEYRARFEMACEEDKLVLSGYFPHNMSFIDFTKYSTDYR